MIEQERLAYDLTADSLVMDIGAFTGEYSVAARRRWDCTVMAFEPVPQFWSGPPHVRLFPFGISDRDEEIEIDLAGERTSAFPEAAMYVGNADQPPGSTYCATGKARIRFRDVVGFMEEHKITQVDLAKINIEGGEYALLRRLIDTGYVSRFRHLQVQFHQFIPDFGEKYLALKKDLLRTHELSWRWPWRWESWQRR